MLRLAGFQWRVTITQDGVGLTSGRNKVLLVFDRSLSGEGLTAGSSNGNFAGSQPAATVPTVPTLGSSATTNSTSGTITENSATDTGLIN